MLTYRVVLRSVTTREGVYREILPLHIPAVDKKQALETATQWVIDNGIQTSLLSYAQVLNPVGFNFVGRLLPGFAIGADGMPHRVK